MISKLISRKPRRIEEDSLIKNLSVTTQLIWLLLVGGILYVVWSVFLPGKERRIPLVEPVDAVDHSDGGISDFKLAELSEPVAVYIAAVSNRNPFTGKGPEQPKPAVQKPVGKTAREKLQERASKLIIVGIDSSRDPQVMLKESQNAETLFLRVGDEVNGLKIKDISGMGILLGYEGEEVLLQ